MKEQSLDPVDLDLRSLNRLEVNQVECINENRWPVGTEIVGQRDCRHIPVSRTWILLDAEAVGPCGRLASSCRCIWDVSPGWCCIDEWGAINVTQMGASSCTVGCLPVDPRGFLPALARNGNRSVAPTVVAAPLPRSPRSSRSQVSLGQEPREVHPLVRRMTLVPPTYVIDGWRWLLPALALLSCIYRMSNCRNDWLGPVRTLLFHSGTFAELW